MNSEFSDDMDILSLERELQSLTPVAPSRQLVQAIKARMEPVPRLVQPAPPRLVSFPWRRMVAPAAAAAAAVAVMNMDGTKRVTRPAAIVGNEPAQAVKWEPMPMLPEFRALLDQGYVLTGDMQFIPADLANLFPGPVWRGSLSEAATRATFPRQDRFIVPAGYGTPAMNMQWK